MLKQILDYITTRGRIPRPRKTLGGDKYWWQEEEEKHLAEKYCMPYGEEVNDAQE